MKKILITGSTGMLGSDCVQSFLNDDTCEVFGLSRRPNTMLDRAHQFGIDLSDPSSIRQINIRPDVIIHTAAITDLGLCERQPELAKRVHVDASAMLAGLLKKDGQLIYISTDSVFDGVKGDYSEKDEPNPLNAYARTKFWGEDAVRQPNAGTTTVIRTNIYGLHNPPGNSLAEWAIREWRAGKPISGFSDILFNAVFTRQLAVVIKYLIDQRIKFPILNVASDKPISKYSFLDALRDALSIAPGLLVPASSDDFPSVVKRPKNTSLQTALLATFHKVPTLDAGIRELVNFARSGHLSI